MKREISSNLLIHMLTMGCSFFSVISCTEPGPDVLIGDDKFDLTIDHHEYFFDSLTFIDQRSNVLDCTLKIDTVHRRLNLEEVLKAKCNIEFEYDFLLRFTIKNTKGHVVAYKAYKQDLIPNGLIIPYGPRP